MSKALNSPTGRLLRSSRLFSMPPPLPQPAIDNVTNTGVLRSSDTSTHPYPTRQAIATPSSSRHRGDWGLKRALPQRSTSSSTPHIRIHAVDNTYHITDFDSAADHTQTLAKWQEMNVPMVMRTSRQSIAADATKTLNSVFEDELDNTALGIEDAEDRSLNPADRALRRALKARTAPLKTRWKTNGPWVGGMKEDEFESFLKSTVGGKGNKAHFMEYLKQVKIERNKNDAMTELRDSGALSESNSEEVDARMQAASRLREGEFDDFVKELRDNHTSISSDLGRLIQEYFDLPPIAPTRYGEDDENKRILGALEVERDPEVGPPATHGSAGLSYIRTNAYMENHPLYGPQAVRSPVQARVVRPRNMVQGGSDYAKLGVGGFVANDQLESRTNFRASESERATTKALTQQFNLDITGGNKIWVHPENAFVDEAGRVRLKVHHGNKAAVAVKTGNEDLGIIIENIQEQMKSQQPNQAEPATRPERGRPGNANYGTALPDTRRPRGFGVDARTERQKVERGEQTALGAIQGLLQRHEDENRRSR